MRFPREAAVPGILVLIACGERPPDSPAANVATPVAATPTLRTLMQELEADAARLASGLWREDVTEIAAAAAAIADHPPIGDAERRAIMETLGTEFSGFVAWDRQVHDLAVEIGTAADAGDVALATSRFTAMTTACVSCHTSYRARLVPPLRTLEDSISP